MKISRHLITFVAALALTNTFAVGAAVFAAEVGPSGAAAVARGVALAPSQASSSLALPVSKDPSATSVTQKPAVNFVPFAAQPPAQGLAIITSTGTGGLWSATTTWVGGAVPTSTSDVIIADGATVTIDTPPTIVSLTVGQGVSGVLQYETATARTVTVSGSVTVAAGGTFKTGAAGALTTHALSVAGNLTNNGTLDLSTTGTAANSCGASLTFTGATSNTFSGAGTTTDLRTLVINKGTSNANILEITTSALTVQGTSTDGAPMAFLTLSNGTLKISGTFALTGRVFTPAAYTVLATTAFWLNNPNFTVASQAGSPTMAGLLRITQGTLNIGQTPFTGLGKPEPLRHELAGWWSRRIRGEHRLVYRVIGHRGDELCQIAQARGHY